jgi:hypothetical protein
MTSIPRSSNRKFDDRFVKSSIFQGPFRSGFHQISKSVVIVAALFGGYGILQSAEIVVTTLDDEAGLPAGAQISLREAIRDAVAGDTVVFEPGIFTAPGSFIGLQAEIVVSKAVTVDGGDASGGVAISGGGMCRIFNVTADGDLTLRGLTLQNGNGAGSTQTGQGGAILNDGSMSIDRCTLISNIATAGGAVYNTGNLVRTLLISNSTLSGNIATAGFGGAIFNDGTLTVTQSTLAGNSVTDPNSGGGAIYNLKSLTLTQTTVSGNQPYFDGEHNYCWKWKHPGRT